MSEQNASNGASRLDPLGLLWRLAAAPQSLMLLLALLILALVLAHIIPQIPARATTDPLAWLATQSTYPEPVNRAIHALRLYDIYHAIWFHLLLALTGLILFVCLFESAELAWRASERVDWRQDDVSLFGPPALQARVRFPAPHQEMQDRLHHWSSQDRYRSTPVDTSAGMTWVLARRARLLWLRPLALAALLIVLAGLVVSGTWGWQNEDWMPAPGEKRPVGHGQPLTIQLESFQPPPLVQGLQHYQSHITWTRDDGSSQPGTTGFGHPAKLDGIAVRQIAYAPIAQLNAIDAEGRPLPLQANGSELSTLDTIEIALRSPDDRPVVYVPTLDLFLSLRFEPECEAQGPTLYVDQVQASGSGATTVGSIQRRGTLDSDDFQLEVNLTYRPVLRVDSRPGMVMVVGGLAVTLLSLTIGWLIEPRLFWLVLEPGKEGTTSIRFLIPPALRGNRWLIGLISHLRAELSHDP
ncbi:MAG: cytochrome c biogenesis protein ResB [Anaerolineae bacterium]|jgi:hypothetical protein